MLTYLVKRLMVSVVVLLGIALGTFLMIHLIPGDPAKIELGIHATPAAVEHLHRGNIVPFNFGPSTAFSAGVSELIGPRVGPTAILLVYGNLISLVIGVP